MNSWKKSLFGRAIRVGVGVGANLRHGAGRLIAGFLQQTGGIVVGVE